MAEKKSACSDWTIYGVDISCTDGSKEAPTKTELDVHSYLDWFQSYPEDANCPAIRLLVAKRNAASRAAWTIADVPFEGAAFEHAFWRSEMYQDMARRASGGCAAMSDSPYRFMLQTPQDGLPFVSLAMSVHGHICKGIYIYDNDDFDPTRITSGETIMSGWRSDGLQIVNVPQGILGASSAWVGRAQTDLLQRIKDIEVALTNPLVDDFSTLLSTLHHCHDLVFSLERRAAFEQSIADSVQDIVAASHYARRLNGWTALHPWQAAHKMRHTDLATTLPRRIENARAAVNDSIFLRGQLQGLQLARATQRIALTMQKDSASMKTIAVMTMLFLPSTAVATFFSMATWDWKADDGDALVSPWIWVYFAVALPMTAVVIAVWWLVSRRRENELMRLMDEAIDKPAVPSIWYAKKVA